MECDFNYDSKTTLLAQKRKIKDKTDTYRWKKRLTKTQFDFTLAYMQKYGPKQFQKHYVDIGQKIAKSHGLIFPRVCVRVKDALVCWFAEHWMLCVGAVRNGIPQEKPVVHDFGPPISNIFEIDDPPWPTDDFISINFDLN